MMQEQIERVFEQVRTLLRTGTFTRGDLIFMCNFLAESLKITRRLMERAGVEAPS